MFTKILIANRGEIACRVIATARKMGIKTVAVYSDADKEARHVKLADEAVHIGAAPSRESYLLADKIIAAAKQTGAQAIHPGYGFLSENEAFAQRCEDEGIAFIGPKAHSIAAMGDKIASKKLANEAKVNTIPGYNDAIENAEKAVEIAKGIGYPVMIKASAGGGGKGMRMAETRGEFQSAFQTAQKEAKSSFADGTMYVERLIRHPRHVEFQIMADSFGNVIHLGERDCSIQRNHQKMIEESPCVAIDDTLRERMGSAAVRAAKAAHYVNAGTIEFLLEPDGNFYFMEMNTRIQVEHPVTEWVTGVDLIQEQLRVASGMPLSVTQGEVRLSGHAIECRINAENPAKNFRPCPGKITEMHLPGGFGVRVDTAAYDGYVIPAFYDSMLAKLIVHGRTREEAIARMRSALGEVVIEGVDTNVDYLYSILNEEEYLAGRADIEFVERLTERL